LELPPKSLDKTRKHLREVGNISSTSVLVILDECLNGPVPKQLRPHVDSFLAEHGLSIPDIALWLTHPGGPKVIDTIESCLELPPKSLDKTRKHLREVGNISSTSVLVILDECLNGPVPKIYGKSDTGNFGMMLSLGPAFSGELVLLQW